MNVIALLQTLWPLVFVMMALSAAMIVIVAAVIQTRFAYERWQTIIGRFCLIAAHVSYIVSGAAVLMPFGGLAPADAVLGAALAGAALHVTGDLLILMDRLVQTLQLVSHRAGGIGTGDSLAPRQRMSWPELVRTVGLGSGGAFDDRPHHHVGGWQPVGEDGPVEPPPKNP